MVETINITPENFLIEPHSRLGESPLYDPETDSLLWVDIIGKKVHWVDYSQTHDIETTRKNHKWVSVGDYIGCLGLTDQKWKYVVGAQYGYGIIDLNNVTPGESISIEYTNKLYKDDDYMRFNDGVVDPKGRFFAGSMWEWRSSPNQNGKLFCMDTDGFVSVSEENIGTPNGMGFSIDQKLFYFTDSDLHTIFKYDYKVETGEISNRREFIKLDDTLNPDGFHIAKDGSLWVAVWGGYAVRRYSSDGVLLQEYKFPANRVSCTAFAGKNMDDLIVTCASLHLKEPDYDFSNAQNEEDKGGAIFRIKLSDVQGTDRHVYKI